MIKKASKSSICVAYQRLKFDEKIDTKAGGGRFFRSCSV